MAMTEVMLYAYIPSLATLIALGIGLMVISTRISDLNTNLNKRIDDLRADTFTRLERLETQYSRLESVMVGKLAEVETRLAKIEAHLEIR
jgi:flagellar capping protein FliD